MNQESREEHVTNDEAGVGQRQIKGSSRTAGNSTVAYWGKPNTRVTSRKVGTVGCGTKTPEGARKSESLGRRRYLASSNLLSQPVLIGDQFVSEAITCTTAGFALATISGSSSLPSSDEAEE